MPKTQKQLTVTRTKMKSY